MALVFSVIANSASAHLLNMTELHLDASDPRAAQFHIKIDLGQSLMTPEDYWEAVTADSGVQTNLLTPALLRLLEKLVVNVDGQPATLYIENWTLEAVSLDAISNPLTPQMATLSFGIDTQANLNAAEIEVRIDEQLNIPWPALLRVDSASSQLPISRLLTSGQRDSRPIAMGQQSENAIVSWPAKLALGFQAWIPGISWMVVGFQHIIPSGLDHIVFVLGLFFLSVRLSTLLYQVSCFTLAHSVTLALATLGIVSVPANIIEPLIAASIIFIAIDNLYSDYLARWRLVIVTLFGLLHGLGFAAALSELLLPTENYLTSLLFFNLGVEAGQITVLLLAFLAVGWMRTSTQYIEKVARPATVTIAGVGTYWLIKRVAVLWI